MKKYIKFIFALPLFIGSFLLGFVNASAYEIPEATPTATLIERGDNVYINFAEAEFGSDTLARWVTRNASGHVDSAPNGTTVTITATGIACGYVQTDGTINLFNVGTIPYTWAAKNNSDVVSFNHAQVTDSIPVHLNKIDCYLTTNIPIFRTQAECLQFRNGDFDLLSTALNYNSYFDSNNWVGVHLDTVYDNNVPVPQFKQANFSGFELDSVPISPDGINNYLYEVQVTVGYENEAEFLYDSNKYGDYVNQTTRPTPNANNSTYYNYGYVTESVYGSTTSFPLKDWNINTISMLWTWVDLHYQYSPSASTYPAGYQMKAYNLFYKPWGASSVYTDVNSIIQSYSHAEEKGLHNTPCTWVKYTVNFVYNDSERGIVTGKPATIYVWGNDQYRNINYSYGQDNALMQDNLQNGLINDNGDLFGGSYGSNFDFNINDTGTFFSYLISVFNGIDNSFTTFASIFSSVFTCLPDFIIWTIFAGIMIMIIIGIVKTVVG